MPGPAYQLIRSQRKTLSIAVDSDGLVVVRAPRRMPKAQIEAFLEQKRPWILEKQELMRERAERHRPSPAATGEEILYLGRKHLLVASDRADAVGFVGETLAFPKAWLDDADGRLRLWYREQARLVLAARLALWSQRTGIGFSSFGITDAGRRWGSCSGREKLNFTWRLVMAPDFAIDYVVVHELVHIEHMNHSSAFWARVEEILPDWRQRERWLRDNAAILRLWKA